MSEKFQEHSRTRLQIHVIHPPSSPRVKLLLFIDSISSRLQGAASCRLATLAVDDGDYGPGAARRPKSSQICARRGLPLWSMTVYGLAKRFQIWIPGTFGRNRPCTVVLKGVEYICVYLPFVPTPPLDDLPYSYNSARTCGVLFEENMSQSYGSFQLSTASIRRKRTARQPQPLRQLAMEVGGFSTLAAFEMPQVLVRSCPVLTCPHLRWLDFDVKRGITSN